MIPPKQIRLRPQPAASPWPDPPRAAVERSPRAAVVGPGRRPWGRRPRWHHQRSGGAGLNPWPVGKNPGRFQENLRKFQGDGPSQVSGRPHETAISFIDDKFNGENDENPWGFGGSWFPRLRLGWLSHVRLFQRGQILFCVYETNSCGKPNHKASLWTKTAFNTPQMDPNRKNAVPGVWLIFGLTMVYQIPLQDSRERWKSKRDNGKTPFWLGRMWCHMICLQIGDLVIAMLGHDLNIFDDFSWRRCCFPISPCCCL